MTALLAGRIVPVATTERWVASSRFLAEVCRANAAEARAAELAERCARLEADCEALAGRNVDLQAGHYRQEYDEAMSLELADALAFADEMGVA